MPELYRGLNGSAGEIRLLSPVPSAENEPGTTWRLKTFVLDSAPPFAALSYLWGDGADTVNVRVNDATVNITSSLACALQHAEHQWTRHFPTRDTAEFYLWADALCINQADIREREEQVTLMGSLYSVAEIVMGSLGPTNEAVQVAIDTLHLVHSKVKDINNLDSMASNIDWMQAYPNLIEADVGLPGDQFDSTKSWKLLREFLYMPYWRRAWVFQEVVLAKELLFFSETNTLDPEALFGTLRWCRTTREIVKTQDVSRPGWLVPSVWNFLTYDNLLGWKSTMRINWARHEDRDGRFFKLLLSSAGSELLATDPRDHIYGTMGLTQIGFEPNYSENSSLADLYAKYMAWWIDEVTAWQAEDPNWTLNHLDLLNEAGTGQISENDTEELQLLVRSVPSWTPNFPLQPKIHTPHILSDQKTIDVDFFANLDAPLPRVEALSLFSATAILDSIVLVDTVKNIKISRGLIGFVTSYLSEHSSYPNGVTPLQALFRTMLNDILDDYEAEAQDVMIRFFAWVHALLIGSETGASSTAAEAGLQAFGFETTSEKEFAESVRNVYFPDMSTEMKAWIERWLAPLLEPAWGGEWQKPEILDICLRTVLEIRELDYTSLAITAKGYVGVVPIGAKNGDAICLMNRSGSAAVIRRAGDFWEYVGRCYSFGLSECRDQQFTGENVQYEILEFR